MEMKELQKIPTLEQMFGDKDSSSSSEEGEESDMFESGPDEILLTD